MADYHIWHAAYTPRQPLTIEAFITLGDSIFLSRGTPAFVQAALKVLGFAIEPASWQMEPMRTHYFSSYRESSGDWEDAWALAWRLRVDLPSGSTPALPDPPGWGYFDLDATDGSFQPNDRPQLWAGWHCLILADFPNANGIESAEGIVRATHPHAVCARGKAFGRYDQLRCDLGYFPRSFYEQGAPEAEALLRQLSETGASLRFSGLEK